MEMRVRTLIGGVLLAVALVPVASRTAWACSCAPSTPRERAQGANAVFTGTVARITDGPRDRVVNFDVDTVYKGERIASIDVHTGFGGGDCGVRFVVDRRYTVFASRLDGHLSAFSCSAPVEGDVDPAALGLPEGVTGLHRPLSPWLVVFSLFAGLAVIVAIALVARRRGVRPAGEVGQAK